MSPHTEAAPVAKLTDADRVRANLAAIEIVPPSAAPWLESEPYRVDCATQGLRYFSDEKTARRAALFACFVDGFEPKSRVVELSPRYALEPQSSGKVYIVTTGMYGQHEQRFDSFDSALAVYAKHSDAGMHTDRLDVDSSGLSDDEIERLQEVQT